MLTPARYRLAWFAAAVFVTIFGAAEFAAWTLQAWFRDGWWGIDLELVLDAGRRLIAGEPLYSDPKFLYPPAAAVVGAVLSPIPFDPLSLAYAAAKIAGSTFVVVRLTPGWPRPAQALAAVTLVGSLPYVHDLFLGNANVVLVLAMAAVVFTDDRRSHGVPLGIATAIFAKPLIVPFLLWMLVWRRASLLGTIVAGLVASAVGLVVAGPASYVDWVEALVGGTRYAAPFEGNHGVTALVPELWLPIAVVTAIGLVLVLARRDPLVGLIWAVASGILLAPYAGTYSALPIALVIPALAMRSPWMAWLIVALSPIATTHPLPIYAAAILLAALTLRDEPAEQPLAGELRPVGTSGA